LVRTRRDGVRVLYSLTGDDVGALLVLLRRVAEQHRTDVGAARQNYLGPDDSDPDEITPDELLERLDDGSSTVLDVRPAEEYAAGHIPGAVSIPVQELGDRIDELDPHAEVVVYCRGEYCVLAYEAVRLLNGRGHRVIRLRDGRLEWRSAGRPVALGAGA
jgi:rhodanese-related sulfurtransferase